MRDVVYKTIVVKLPALVPGGLCAPPTRVACPCLVVLRADVQTLARCRGRGVILYLHGNGTDIGGAAEEAKTLARELDCHVVVPEYPGYGLAEGTPSEDSVDAVAHAAARFIEKTMGAPRDRVIIYGRSVGTGPAAAAAARLSRGAFSEPEDDARSQNRNRARSQSRVSFSDGARGTGAAFAVHEHIRFRAGKTGTC